MNVYDKTGQAHHFAYLTILSSQERRLMYICRGGFLGKQPKVCNLSIHFLNELNKAEPDPVQFLDYR